MLLDALTVFFLVAGSLLLWLNIRRQPSRVILTKSDDDGRRSIADLRSRSWQGKSQLRKRPMSGAWARSGSADRGRDHCVAFSTRRQMALDGEIDNHYKRITALSQAAAASIALFQRYCRFEAVSLQSAVANSENELIARK
jgi:hypothetical protein